MNEYRVTKYDPLLRNASDAYVGDSWTSYSDIGSTFGGVLLTESEYERIENAYGIAATAFLNENGCSFLNVRDLEPGRPQHRVLEGAALNLADIAKAIRDVLRDEYWCRLEGDSAYIHLGYDFYMYVGVASPCPRAISLAFELGLFVEPFKSPYQALD